LVDRRGGSPVFVTRRELLTLIGAGAAVWPVAARPATAQARRERISGVGMLLGAYTQTDRAGQIRLETYRKELQGLGWTEARNVRLDYRFGDGNADRVKVLAAGLVQSAPDAIVVAGDPALAELQRLTKTIPIVFTQVSDPIASGFVASLARPGGNITGFQNFEPEMGGKWLGVLVEAAPHLRRVAALVVPGTAPHTVFLNATQAAAGALGVTVEARTVSDIGELERAIVDVANEPGSGLIVFPHPLTIAHRALIHALALRHRMPTIYPYKYFASDGGFLSYGPDQVHQWRGAAGYIDRILRGETPSGFPVQAPTRYELVINLRTAKALGLTVPPMLLARADEAIE
jgi:putative ABC transport system substrate-binding protein